MIELDNIEDITYDYMTKTMVILLKEPILHERYMKKELIEHKDQSFLDDFLKEENVKCLKCRHCVNETCSNRAAIDFYLCKVNYVDTTDCNGYYPLDDNELYSYEDIESERMEF